MFEDEVKLEEQSHSMSFRSPLLYIFLLIVVIGIGAGYWLFKQQKDLAPDQASVVLSEALKVKGPAFVHFHVGLVKASVDEKPRDPHYKLLEKAGYVKLKSAKDGALNVSLTALGEGTFSKLPEFQKGKNPDGTETLMVPLATRQLVQVDKITMTSPNSARVEYVWKWNPNNVGKVFDATSSEVKSFTTWDRATLIKSYGVDFYGEQQKTFVNMIRTSNGWRIGEVD